MMVFTGNANPQLALDIVNHLKMPLGKALLATLCEGLGVPEDAIAELWPPGTELYPEAAPLMELLE